jgi:type VI secretion system secreted protein VgrG
MGLDTSSLAGGLSSVQSAVQGALAAIIGRWRTDTRLYTLSAPSSERSLPADLMVESFVLHEAVSQPFSLYINALVLDAHVELKQLYARPISLHTTLADGSRTRRSGHIVQAESLGSDGGFARTAEPHPQQPGLAEQVGDRDRRRRVRRPHRHRSLEVG